MRPAMRSCVIRCATSVGCATRARSNGRKYAESCTKLGAGFPAILRRPDARDEEAYNIQHRVLGDGPDRGASATCFDAAASTMRAYIVCESARASESARVLAEHAWGTLGSLRDWLLHKTASASTKRNIGRESLHAKTVYACVGACTCFVCVCVVVCVLVGVSVRAQASERTMHSTQAVPTPV